MTSSLGEGLASIPLEQSSRSKLRPILESATHHFGAKGFESAKWSDVAADVGIGQTALYHYFQSKTECLFALIVVQFEEAAARFDAAIEGVEDPHEQIQQAIASNFDLEGVELLRSRIVVSERNRLAELGSTGREEEMRQLARSWARQTELRWAEFLRGHMERGAVPHRDEVFLTRAVLGLTSSVYSWYRSDGPVPLSLIRDFIIDAAMRMVLH